MCNFLSWVESEGNCYVVTDAEVQSKFGKELLKQNWSLRDVFGHAFCREYYKLGKAGVDKEVNRISSLSSFPPELHPLLKDIKKHFSC